MKKYNEFIKESLGIRLDQDGKPRCTAFDGDINHGDIDYTEVENLKPSVVDEFIEEIKRCLEVNHEVLVNDLSDRLDLAIKKTFGGDFDKWYFKPVDTEKDSDKFTFYYDDISIAFAKLINLGYSVGYVSQKFGARNWNFSKFFGYDGEVFTSEKDFKKISNDFLDYNGPDISHHCILAGSFDIKTSLSEENITYGIEDQGRSEISVIFARPFSYGYDAGAKMVDLERDLFYKNLGTTYDRYHDLMMNDNKTPVEEAEFDEIKRKEDTDKYGEEWVARREQERKEFNALSKEEQEERKRINNIKLKVMMAELFKDLDKESE